MIIIRLLTLLTPAVPPRLIRHILRHRRSRNVAETIAEGPEAPALAVEGRGAMVADFEAADLCVAYGWNGFGGSDCVLLGYSRFVECCSGIDCSLLV